MARRKLSKTYIFKFYKQKHLFLIYTKSKISKVYQFHKTFSRNFLFKISNLNQKHYDFSETVPFDAAFFSKIFNFFQFFSINLLPLGVIRSIFSAYF